MTGIYFDCSWRRPCPICYRCMLYAPHRYARCRWCVESFKPCHHKEKSRSLLIKRRNFVLSLPASEKAELEPVLRDTGKES